MFFTGPNKKHASTISYLESILAFKIGFTHLSKRLKQNGTQSRHHFSGITLFAHARGRLGFILFQVLALELGFHSSAVFSIFCNMQQLSFRCDAENELFLQHLVTRHDVSTNTYAPEFSHTIFRYTLGKL